MKINLVLVILIILGFTEIAESHRNRIVKKMINHLKVIKYLTYKNLG